MNEFDINSLLIKAVELKASDVHLIAGEVPSFRIYGNIIKLEMPALTQEQIEDAINAIVPFNLRDKVFKDNDSDFPYEIKKISRFRINIGKALGCYKITIRIIPYNIPSFEELNFPENIENFTNVKNGIIIVTGAAGSGKSTTIASIVENINSKYKKHIITIEDPIEYVYESKKAIFTQRQIGTDTKDYLDGIKYALRQDPDIIVIGEIRDKETIESALYAAETGHLVFATLHTFNAIQTINRILSFFEPSEREYVREQLAEVLRGTISQKLLPKANKNGRIAAFEVLLSTPTIKDFILKNEVEEIYKLIKKGNYNNMITFNQNLYSLIQQGIITKETAIEYSDSPNELMHYIRGVYTGSEGL